MSDLFSQFVKQAGEWMRGVGPLHEIVISTRIRLARNLANYRFISKTDAADKRKIAHEICDAIRAAPSLNDYLNIDIEELDELDRALLVERHLISRQQAEASGARRLVFDRNEAAAMMINEEDHLRLQVMRSGFQLDDAWTHINRIDDELQANLDIAFHPQFGFLTACPTNVGTGLRVSVMLHLPALRLTNEIDRVAQAAKDLKLAIRG
ncbi:MAG: ATP--guanido phosphotransferase, partial [Phycisphaerae bacterium]